MPEPSIVGDARPYRVWWTLLLQRVEQVRLKLPSSLRGVVQLEIEGASDTVFLRLDVDGAKTRGRDGLARKPDCWVSTTDEELGRLLTSGAPVENALRASGRIELFTGLLDRLAELPPSGNWLKLRAAR